MKALKIEGKSSLNQKNKFSIFYALKMPILLLFLISLGGISKADIIYEIDSQVNKSTKVIKLRNIFTGQKIYFSLDNFTIGDYDILKSIDFKISDDAQDYGENLQIQALKNGAGWIANPSLSSKEEINALLFALREHKGIWEAGYMKRHANIRTYGALSRYFKTKGMSISNIKISETVDDEELAIVTEDYSRLVKENSLLRFQHEKDILEKDKMAKQAVLKAFQAKKKQDSLAKEKALVDRERKDAVARADEYQTQLEQYSKEAINLRRVEVILQILTFLGIAKTYQMFMRRISQRRYVYS